MNSATSTQPDRGQDKGGRDKSGGWKRTAKALGPGIITGASDDDPSGIATYAQAGASFSNGMLWSAPVSVPFMIAVQEICDRTALATGKSLGALARQKFTRGTRVIIAVLLVALLVANGVNLAADLMAVGEGVELIGGGPAQLWSALAGLGISVALISGSFSMVSKVFKWLCLALFAYVIVLFVTKVDWADVLAGLLFQQVSWDLKYWGLVAAIFGTTISPYLFFWQSAHRVEELRSEKLKGDKAPDYADRSRDGAKSKEISSRVDVFAGMAFSVLVMFAIIVATAATLGTEGTPVESAADAAKALEPVAGPLAKLLFALGFIGSGILAVPVLAASGATGMAALLGKSWGLERSPRKAPVFYAILLAGTVAGTGLAVVLDNPISLLILSATINAVAATPFLIITMVISADKNIMGKAVNGPLATTLGWATAVLMAIFGVIGLWATFSGN